MNFNLRFLITLMFVILVVLSFILIILEIVGFSGVSNYEFTVQEGEKIKDVPLNEVKKDTQYTIKTLGSNAGDIKSSTNFYRYGNVVIHVIAIMSGLYLLYTN